ncbi:hypothetical protein DL96DRAFT_1615394 [Flagelloscypha sp. PMI_526]|nr:hypothetical protein DL96DRAFT_1615394 [Flagelloscypha sp. PMI_526]
MISSLGESSSNITLPTELLVIILEILAYSYPRSSARSILLISKTLHHCLLPRVYHTLDLAGDEGIHAKEGINRDVFLDRANPTSLTYVRRLKSNVYSSHFPLSSFSNLTFLALWGSQRLYEQPTVASALTMAPLEEIIIWSEGDSRAFLKAMSPSSSILQTLRRLTARSSAGHEPSPGWLQCKNLTHILALCKEVNKIEKSAIFEIHTHCLLEYYGIGLKYPASMIDMLNNLIPQDKRIVVLEDAQPRYLYLQENHFWSGVSNVWDRIEDLVRKKNNSLTLSC